MASIAKKQINLSTEQITLLKRYISLYNAKMRDYAAYLRDEKKAPEVPISIEFTEADIDYILVSLGKKESQMARQALTSLAVLLLKPSAPFANESVAVKEYLQKILNKKELDIEGILLCSIIAAADKHILELLNASNII